MDDCYFCKSIQQGSGLDFISDLETELFVAAWDVNPATPGHALVIPKHHVQYMRNLSVNEQENLIKLIIAAKDYIEHVDLENVYKEMVRRMASTKSEGFINLALARLQSASRPPEAFNDGLNDGPAAGQTVPHFHWHIMPRWQGDIADPRGGIRHMFPGMGNYHDGISATA